MPLASATPLGAVGLALLLWLAAYLVGGIPTGWIVGRALGVELREVGTGKIGTSNLFRNGGWLPAAVVGPLQFCQGLGPVWLAERAGAGAVVVAGAGLCAVIGNGWPAYFRYHGGRGVATATGAVSLWWLPGFLFLLALLGLGGLTRRSALGVLVGFLGLPVVLYLTGAPGAQAVTAVGICICIALRRLEGYAGQRKNPSTQEGPVDSWRDRLLFDRRPGQRLVGPRNS
ncbi:MAG TPA: glycerol-3-phosphate acyltransferase [Candidatus Dormibacteraeota bacterium]|nr:glycerol-3-phosphate acyltransferase [Candidatus Dormibacteraeota bacterium]